MRQTYHHNTEKHNALLHTVTVGLGHRHALAVSNTCNTVTTGTGDGTFRDTTAHITAITHTHTEMVTVTATIAFLKRRHDRWTRTRRDDDLIGEAGRLPRSHEQLLRCIDALRGTMRERHANAMRSSQICDTQIKQDARM
jgi:hypothetical protein